MSPWLLLSMPGPVSQGLFAKGLFANGPGEGGTSERGGRVPADGGSLERELEATRSMRVPPSALRVGCCRESAWVVWPDTKPGPVPPHPLLLALLDRSMESYGEAKAG
ncbi:MAG TPA: hypothetical protein VK150_08565, partial [Geothrix sp.]|nr:hypothetical protein [Geothrix sp.]